MIAYFKLKSALSYTTRSVDSGMLYTWRKGDIIPVQNQHDILRFRGMTDMFVEVDQYGREVSLLDSENPEKAKYEGAKPKSYGIVDSVPEKVKRQLDEMKLEKKILEEQKQKLEEEQKQKLEEEQKQKLEEEQKQKLEEEQKQKLEEEQKQKLEEEQKQEEKPKREKKKRGKKK